MSDTFPGTASSLLLQGTITSQTNLDGDGEPHLHPAVQEFFDGLAPSQREPFLGHCAESALVSDRLHAVDAQRTDGGTTTLSEAPSHFAGAALVSRKVRPHGDPEHGTPAPLCRSCAALADVLGITVLQDS
ncbi:YwqJ-related putative deaminase [Streptomyces sp. NPDC002773]|uniref:YwqJ-related putative deaminase n=1 Tax=Streptomyces sp. NPDC002773 TaxID=3154430 RepID=UPI00332C8A9F